MLAQLLCVDRRFQRMNCFNIREVEALLKQRFFAELINTDDNHQFRDSTIVGLKYRNTLNLETFINSNFNSILTLGPNTNTISKTFIFKSNFRESLIHYVPSHKQTSYIFSSVSKMFIKFSSPIQTPIVLHFKYLKQILRKSLL